MICDPMQRMNYLKVLMLFNLLKTSHADSMREPETDLEINAKAQLSLLESIRKSPHAIVVSLHTPDLWQAKISPC